MQLAQLSSISGQSLNRMQTLSYKSRMKVCLLIHKLYCRNCSYLAIKRVPGTVDVSLAVFIALNVGFGRGLKIIKMLDPTNIEFKYVCQLPNPERLLHKVPPRCTDCKLVRRSLLRWHNPDIRQCLRCRRSQNTGRLSHLKVNKHMCID